MDQLKLNHLREEGNQYQHLLDVVNLDELQNLDELNLDVGQTFLDVAHQLHQLDVAVDAELRHQLRMDYFLDAVGAELRHLLRMDCCRDAAELERLKAQLDLLELQQQFQLELGVRYCFQQLLALAQPSVQLNQRQVLLLIQRLVLDWLRPFSQQLSLRQPF
jgi:hypothetical protein